MKSKVRGLDIGSTSIKVAYLRQEGGNFILDSIATSPFAGKGLASESLADLQELSNTIKSLLESSNIRIINAALSIAEGQVYTKVIEMPDLSEQELAAALKFELEQYVPLPLDQARTDWEILSKNEKDGKKTMDVMLVAAPLKKLEKYEKLMKMTGLIPDVIETEIVSVHRSLLPTLSVSDSNMLVHIGASDTSVSLLYKGAIKAVFASDVGGSAISRAISLELGIDINQADTYKKAYGLSSDVFVGKIGHALSPILESVVADIKKTIFSYKEKNNNEEIKQIILSGGTALLPGINAYFTNQIGTQVVTGNCFTAYNIKNVPKEIVVDAPAYNVVIGLALRNLI